jgi:anti-anti-sigma regulatory factor
MDAYALTVKTVRDGPVCTLILRGDLDLLETGRFLEQAALAADDQTGRLAFDLAGVLFLDGAGVRALRIATRCTPAGGPVITGSLSPMPRRIVELLGLDLANPPELSPSHGLRDGPRDSRTARHDLVPVELGAPFLAGTEGCP